MTEPRLIDVVSEPAPIFVMHVVKTSFISTFSGSLSCIWRSLVRKSPPCLELDGLEGGKEEVRFVSWVWVNLLMADTPVSSLVKRERKVAIWVCHSEKTPTRER